MTAPTCEQCDQRILAGHERVGLLRNGALLVFHARCFGMWAAGSHHEEIDRLAARHGPEVVAAAERVIGEAPAA